MGYRAPFSNRCTVGNSLGSLMRHCDVPPRQAVCGVVHTDDTIGTHHVEAATVRRACSTWYDTTALVLKPLWAILDGLGDLGNSLIACPARNGPRNDRILIMFTRSRLQDVLRVLTHFSQPPSHSFHLALCDAPQGCQGARDPNRRMPAHGWGAGVLAPTYSTQASEGGRAGGRE